MATAASSSFKLTVFFVFVFFQLCCQNAYVSVTEIHSPAMEKEVGFGLRAADRNYHCPWHLTIQPDQLDRPREEKGEILGFKAAPG